MSTDHDSQGTSNYTPPKFTQRVMEFMQDKKVKRFNYDWDTYKLREDSTGKEIHCSRFWFKDSNAIISQSSWHGTKNGAKEEAARLALPILKSFPEAVWK